MEFTFAIENHDLQKMFTQIIHAESVPAAWSQINEIVQLDEEATLVYIDDSQVGEPLKEYKNE
jgi:hypothetical protein